MKMMKTNHQIINTNRLLNEINQLKKDGYKDIYINVINCTVEEINELKELIRNNKLIPDINLLNTKIKKEYINDFLHGKAVCPQMLYYFNFTKNEK